MSHEANQRIEVQSVLDGVTLPSKSQVCSLDVLLDSSLSLDIQGLAATRNAFAKLKLVCQLHLFLSDLATVTHALDTSCLGSCSALYVKMPLKIVQKLQLVQSASYCKTGLATIPFPGPFKVLVIIYQTLHSLGPG